MLLKSLFVSLYITLLHGSAVYASYQLYVSGFHWLWVGLLLTSVPGALLFDWLLAFKPVARTSSHLLSLSLIKLIGLLLVVSISFSTDTIHPLNLGLALSGFFGWIGYDYWFSQFGNRQSEILSIGRQLPNLSFETIDKHEFQTDSLTGKPALLLFYRGNWCPLCMAQIREIAAQYQQLAERGVNILLISPQPHDHTQSLAERFNVPFKFLVDNNNKVARQLGIFAKNGLPFGMQIFGYDSDTVLPTAVITDATGKIIFADLTDNYRVRPEPATFLQVLDEYSA